MRKTFLNKLLVFPQICLKWLVVWLLKGKLKEMIKLQNSTDSNIALHFYSAYLYPEKKKKFTNSIEQN